MTKEEAWKNNGCPCCDKDGTECDLCELMFNNGWDAALLKDSAKTPLCCQAADKINYEKGLGLTKCPICYREIQQ
jgi:hypothetical protein